MSTAKWQNIAGPKKFFRDNIMKWPPNLKNVCGLIRKPELQWNRVNLSVKNVFINNVGIRSCYLKIISKNGEGGSPLSPHVPQGLV